MSAQIINRRDHYINIIHIIRIKGKTYYINVYNQRFNGYIGYVGTIYLF